MIGSRIGQYRVLSLLGEGGMGKVFLVEHAVLGTRHALKMLHEEMSSNGMIVQRFLNEARAASAIGHRNVVEISHVDQVDGRGAWYLVMRYLEGQTLTQFLDSRATLTDQRLIVHFIGEALNGLQAAHDRRIIHRDLKPDNLFLTAVKGDPYRTVLLDFGVAQLGQDAGFVTKSGLVIGTPQYMAPEQHRGAAIDHRADIWAIGAIVYEIATGRFPYQDDPARSFLTGPEIFHRMMSRAVPDPRHFNPRLTEGFASAILKALSIEPGQRPGSARELAVMLAEATPGDRDMPSGLELLRIHAEELLLGVAPLEPARWPPPTVLVAPPMHADPERRDMRATERIRGVAMSTLGASASDASAAIQPPRRRRRWLALGLVAVAAALVVVAARDRAAPPTASRENTMTSSDADAVASTADATAVVAVASPPADAADAPPPDAADAPDVSPPAPAIDAGQPDAVTVAPHPAPAGTGRLDVIILPWAEVWVDGKPRGQTPVHAKLSAGPHRVRLKNDTKEKTVTVTVTAGKTAVIDEAW